jgi:hypothetical protein
MSETTRRKFMKGAGGISARPPKDLTLFRCHPGAPLYSLPFFPLSTTARPLSAKRSTDAAARYRGRADRVRGWHQAGRIDEIRNRCRAGHVASRARRESTGDHATPTRGETLLVSVVIVSMNCRSYCSPRFSVIREVSFHSSCRCTPRFGFVCETSLAPNVCVKPAVVVDTGQEIRQRRKRLAAAPGARKVIWPSLERKSTPAPVLMARPH